jgi:hypothetical protein
MAQPFFTLKVRHLCFPLDAQLNSVRPRDLFGGHAFTPSVSGFAANARVCLPLSKREFEAQSLKSLGIFNPSRILSLLQPLRPSHVLHNGSHGANLKLLKIRALMNVFLTKVREVTNARNFLILMVGFVTAS